MKKKMKLEKFAGLEWVTVTNVPCQETKFGSGIDAKVLKRIEELVAGYIVEKCVPIRGAEVEFLRKTLGYSLGKIAAELGFSAPAILKWERARTRHLDRVNEVAVRTWAAEKLGLKITGQFSKLVAREDKPDPVTLKAA